MEILMWVMTFVAILGTVLNVKKYRLSFVLWFISNGTFVVYNITLHAYAQAFLFIVYSGIAAWGWIEWGKKEKA